MRTIQIVGRGYAGFSTARHLLEKRLRADEAEVVVLDPRPYLTYRPFPPEVAAGGVEAHYAAVSLPRHLHRTTGCRAPSRGSTTSTGRRSWSPGAASARSGSSTWRRPWRIRARLLASFDLALVPSAAPTDPGPLLAAGYQT